LRRSGLPDSRYCAHRLFGNTSLSYSRHWAGASSAHPPSPSCSARSPPFGGPEAGLRRLLLGSRGTRGTMDDMLAGVSPRVECTVAPTDPGWIAGGRRRERLPLPRAYDKYYGTSLLRPSPRWFLNPIPDGDLGASARHSCTPSAHTGPPPKLLWARAALVVTPHPRARFLSPDVPPRTQVKAGSVTPTFTFFPAARRPPRVPGNLRCEADAPGGWPSVRGGERCAHASLLTRRQGVDVWDVPALLLRARVGIDVRSHPRFVARRMRRSKCCKSRW
jgi:hypothetical protein